jgi:hypothetical protein
VDLDIAGSNPVSHPFDISPTRLIDLRVVECDLSESSGAAVDAAFHLHWANVR